MNLPLLFAMGISGSLHCAGMCGPLAALARGRGFAFYLAGKTSSYVLLGALAGALGRSVGWAAGGRALAVGAGALLLVAGLHSLGVIRDVAIGASASARMGHAIASLAGEGIAGKLVLGSANGLLPCPMTYAFAAMAAATGSPIAGAGTMLVLASTAALPLAASTLLVRQMTRLRWPYLSGLLMLLAAAFTIYRGLAIGPTAICH